MKKLLSALLILTLTIPASATMPKKRGGGSQYLTCGLRGTFNNTWLLNKNMLDDKGLKYQPSFGGSGGIQLGFHLSHMVAINVEGLYSVYNQKMKSAIDSVSWNSRTSLAYIELPVLLRFEFENFKYLEFGVKMGFLNSAKSDFTSGNINLTGTDVKKNYEKNNTSLVFGWGSGLYGSGGMLINFGIRLQYGISDIVSDAGGKGNPYYSTKDGTKMDYQKTNIVTAGLHLTLDFDLGWFMSSNCGRSHKFVLFNH